MTKEREAQQHRPLHDDSKHPAQHKDTHQAHEKLLTEVHQLSYDGQKRPGHSAAHPHTESTRLKHADKTAHSGSDKTGAKHLPQLKIFGFDPGECLTGQASHYGQGDGFFALRPRAKLAGLFLVGLSDWALPIPFSLPAKWLLGLLLACEIGRGLSQLELSMLAHLAGFMCGYLSARITLSEAKAEEASL